MSVKFAFDLSPDEAIAFLKQKKAFIEKANTHELLHSARAKAARIANLSSLEMTRDIYQSLIEAQAKGQSFGQWREGMMAMFAQKGWIAGYDKTRKSHLLADPKTGEIFGSPRRLQLIYRTNMQAAYSAQRYQQQRENVDSRPYWQYSAILDARTRPRHAAMNGAIYRYDDPFWATFYPPNGFNCRCSVKALGERDVQRSGLSVGDSRERLVEVNRVINQQGDTEPTIGFKQADGSVLMTDKGFDYNVGRMSYRPNLDLYPEALAHQFAKVEMAGGEFAWAFEKLQKAVNEIKTRTGTNGKLSADEMLVVREQLRLEFKFAAGRIADRDAALMKLNTQTAWLSDDTLIKQFNSREGQDFGIDVYSTLPDIIHSPDKIIVEENRNFQFFKQVGDKKLMAALKVIDSTNEIFVQSFRLVSEKQWKKAFK